MSKSREKKVYETLGRRDTPHNRRYGFDNAAALPMGTGTTASSPSHVTEALWMKGVVSWAYHIQAIYS